MYYLKYYLFNGKNCRHRGYCEIESNTLDGALSQAEVLVDRIFPHLNGKWGGWTDTEIHETETHTHCKIKRYTHEAGALQISFRKSRKRNWQ